MRVRIVVAFGGEAIGMDTAGVGWAVPAVLFLDPARACTPRYLWNKSAVHFSMFV